MNSGTKTEPKFGAPADLKADLKSAPNRPPVGWDIDIGFERGNVMGDATVVKKEDDATLGLADKEAALRVGYATNANKVMPPPYIMVLSQGNFQTASVDVNNAPSNFARVSQAIRTPLVPNKPYTLTFKVRGNRVSNGQLAIYARGSKRFGEDRQVVGERGRVAVQRNVVTEAFRDTVSFSPGGSWTEVKKTFTVKFKEKDLSDLEKTDEATINFFFQLQPGDGVLYIKDVKIEG
jgi:hypothetical protein